MQPVPFIDFGVQYAGIREEIRAAVHGVLDSQQFILKDRVAELETAIARAVGVKHAIGCASGTDALYLVLAALGVGAGDEVVTTPFTFFATAGCISRAQARPVFADIDPRTFQIDPESVRRALTTRTRAIMPVHLFGLCADMDALSPIAASKNLPVIEDAAQAYGAAIGGRKAGAMSNAGCLSFFPTKNLGGGGDGGMITTSDDKLADKIRLLRVHGSKIKYHHEIIGINSRLDEIQAAILLVKLKYVDRWNDARIRLAAQYDEGLKGLPVWTPAKPAGYRHIYHLYTVRAEKRDALVKSLTEKGVGSGVYYPVLLHLQPCYRDLGYKPGDFPQTEKACSDVVSLPMYPEMTADYVSRVISAIRGFYGK